MGLRTACDAAFGCLFGEMIEVILGWIKFFERERRSRNGLRVDQGKDQGVDLLALAGMITSQ
jgi:hypothetical protein